MQLTKDFNKIEFESRDGARMPAVVFSNVKELAKNLQIIREALGFPMIINSAYRSPAHNKRVGGVSNSQHVKGTAADISTKKHTPEELAKLIDKLMKLGKIKQGGIGLYNTFVHYDIRGISTRWNYSTIYKF